MEHSETRTGRCRFRRESSARTYPSRKEHAPSPVMEIRRWKLESKENEASLSMKRTANRRTMSATEYADFMALRVSEYRPDQEDIGLDFVKLKLDATQDAHDEDKSDFSSIITDSSTPSMNTPHEIPRDVGRGGAKRNHRIRIVHNYMRGGNVPNADAK